MCSDWGRNDPIRDTRRRALCRVLHVRMVGIYRRPPPQQRSHSIHGNRSGVRDLARVPAHRSCKRRICQTGSKGSRCSLRNVTNARSGRKRLPGQPELRMECSNSHNHQRKLPRTSHNCARLPAAGTLVPDFGNGLPSSVGARYPKAKSSF